MKHDITVAYENVLLRPTLEADIESLRVWRNDPANTAYLRPIPPITREQQAAWFRATDEKKNEYLFSVVETRELHALVGSLSLYGITDRDAEFGRFLVGEPRAHGKKVGQNALHAALLVAFEKLGLSRVHLTVYKNNVPAIRVYSAVGFENVGECGTGDASEWLMEITKERFSKR